MPKLSSRPAAQAPLGVVEAPAPAALVAAPERPVHSPADHMVFQNADGTRSRVCICICDRCWPPDAGKNPGPCPDWNDEV